MYHAQSSADEIGGARRGVPIIVARPFTGLGRVVGLGLAVVTLAATAGCAAPKVPFTPAPVAVRAAPSVAANPLPPLAAFTTEANGTRVANVSADYLFALDSYDLLPEAKTALGKILPTILAGFDPVQIIGFTDGTGTGAANLELSQRRAMAVRAWLISQGVGQSRITAAGKGALGSKAGVADARARRVEIVLK